LKKINDGLTKGKRYYRRHREKVILASRAKKKKRYWSDPEAALRKTWEDKLRWKYGISVAIYEQMLEDQAGVCGICKEQPFSWRLDVDHNHETGEVRGLLCRKCNMAVGLINDSPEAAHRMELWLLKKGK
jgi:hypothetical protein